MTSPGHHSMAEVVQGLDGVGYYGERSIASILKLENMYEHVPGLVTRVADRPVAETRGGPAAESGSVPRPSDDVKVWPVDAGPSADVSDNVKRLSSLLNGDDSGTAAGPAPHDLSPSG